MSSHAGLNYAFAAAFGGVGGLAPAVPVFLGGVGGFAPAGRAFFGGVGGLGPLLTGVASFPLAAPDLVPTIFVL